MNREKKGAIKGKSIRSYQVPATIGQGKRPDTVGNLVLSE